MVKKGKKTQGDYRRKWRLKKNKLERDAKRIWQIACYKKWGRRCQVCNKEATTVHHFFPKSQYGILKFDIDNGVPICNSCHFKHHQVSDPTIHQIIIGKRGKKWYDALEEKSKSGKTSFRGTRFYKQEMERLEKEIKKM